MIDKNLNYGRHHIADFLKKSLPYTTVVDLGAGQGDDLMLAKKQNPDAVLYALESYAPYVKTLKEKGINVFSVDLEKDRLPFEDESIDVVMINQVFEHVKEVFWIMHEVTRVLKVGGHFIIGVPNLASLHNRLLLLIGNQPTCIQNDSAHVRGYTRNDFFKLLDSGFPGGYKLEQFGGSNFYPFPAVIAKPLARLFPTMAWSMFMLLKKERSYMDDGYAKFPITKQLETNFFTGPYSR
ncbi:class I SAM-dependent methyltransferase [Spirosoma telluris]